MKKGFVGTGTKTGRTPSQVPAEGNTPKGAPFIRHVFNTAGRHCIEVDGKRGVWAMYEHPALHPAGYMALTDYHADAHKDEAEALFKRGMLDVVPEGGCVFAINRVSHDPHCTVPADWHKEGDDHLPFEQTRQYFAYMDKCYENETPLHPLIVKCSEEAEAEYIRNCPEVIDVPASA